MTYSRRFWKSIRFSITASDSSRSRHVGRKNIVMSMRRIPISPAHWEETRILEIFSFPPLCRPGKGKMGHQQHNSREEGGGREGGRWQPAYEEYVRSRPSWAGSAEGNKQLNPLLLLLLLSIAARMLFGLTRLPPSRQRSCFDASDGGSNPSTT